MAVSNFLALIFTMRKFHWAFLIIVVGQTLLFATGFTFPSFQKGSVTGKPNGSDRCHVDTLFTSTQYLRDQHIMLLISSLGGIGATTYSPILNRRTFGTTIFGTNHSKQRSGTNSGVSSSPPPLDRSGRHLLRTLRSSVGSHTSRTSRTEKDKSRRPQYKGRATEKVSTASTDRAIEAGSLRLNKCLIGLSRRAADQAIADGRVTINSIIAVCGARVTTSDVVRLDGKIQKWQEISEAKKNVPARRSEERKLLYLKYWKPLGVTCTSDNSEPTNIISAGRFNLLPQRVFTVGRLDKDSTGLILLTSDGRVNNALLDQAQRKEKVYVVEMDKVPTQSQIERMAAGIVISTPIQRDRYNNSPKIKRGNEIDTTVSPADFLASLNKDTTPVMVSRDSSGGGGGTHNSVRKSKTILVTAPTLPCTITRLGNQSSTGGIGGMSSGCSSSSNSRRLEFRLVEGRNRQIRRMAEAVGLNVVSLHR